MFLTKSLPPRARHAADTAFHFGALILVGLTLSSCAEYLDRSDSVTRYSGDAQAINKATHIVDPWPHAARHGKIYADGERVRIGVDRYRSNQTIKPKTLRGSADIGGTEGAGSDGAPTPSN